MLRKRLLAICEALSWAESTTESQKQQFFVADSPSMSGSVFDVLRIAHIKQNAQTAFRT
jgi:hypothetical protein